MTTVKPKLLTADDLLRLYSKGVKGELIRGVLHETMASGVRHGKIAMLLGSRFCHTRCAVRIGPCLRLRCRRVAGD